MSKRARVSAAIIGIGLFLSGIAAPYAQDVQAQETSYNRSTYAYVELIGKGFFSANVDWPLGPKGRLTAGLTLLDYELDEVDEEGNYRSQPLPSPSVMLFFLNQNKEGNHFLEAGFGISTNPVPWRDFAPEDSAISLHGSVGYRYQGTQGTLFRIGFTPFYRFNWMLLPLIGVSLGWQL